MGGEQSHRRESFRDTLTLIKSVCVCACVWGVQEHAGVLSFHHVSSKNRTLILKLGKKHLYLLESLGLNL